MRIVAAASLLACTVAFTSSCMDTISSPTPPAAPSLTASLAPAHPVSHPNSEKYRDAGFHPATGRSGSAVVSARALRGKSGTTDVEVTTGTFDEGPAPGTLARVQVKAFTPSGELAFTDNHNGSSAAASFSYTTLPHGTPLQLQTIVHRTGDPGSDVVTLNDVVHFRPDLVAWGLQGRRSAPVGAAVNLRGFVYEGNGELGARADCVLYVDGTAVDRASNIWVDAAGSVDCAMTHVFTQVGTYSLELRVENVRPSDFDDSNNRVTTSIAIVEPSDFTFYSFQAWAIADTSWWHSVSTLLTWEGNLETWDQIYTRQGTAQFATLSGLIHRVLNFSAPITLRGEMSTNGATVNTVDDTYGSLPFVDWQGGYCDYKYNFDTRGVTYICVYPSSGYTYVQYDWTGANIHYTSNSYVYYWDPSGALHEAWYANNYSDFAPMVTLGPDFSGRLSVQGADDPQPLTVQATVQFEPTDLYFDYVDPSCATSPAPPGCFELHGHTVGVMGYTDYGGWPPNTP